MHEIASQAAGEIERTFSVLETTGEPACAINFVSSRGRQSRWRALTHHAEG